MLSADGGQLTILLPKNLSEFLFGPMVGIG